jgi:hypothetical protein
MERAMFDRVLERIRKRRRGIGTLRLSLYALVWLLRTLTAGVMQIHYRYVLIQPVPREPLLPGGPRGTLEIHVLSGETLRRENQRDRNGAFSRPPRDEERFRRRVERGDVCIAAIRRERVEGVLWLSFDTFDESGVTANFVVSPERGIAWDSNLYIVEDARGGLLFAALWDGANALLRERGYRWVATQTSAFNGPSLQAHTRMGSRRIGRIVYLCVDSFQVTLSDLRPRLALAIAGDEGPTFVIPAPVPSGARVPA